MKLITTIQEVQSHIPVNMTSDIDTVAPYLSNAERVHIKALIGKNQYDALVTAYDAAGKILSAVVDEDLREAIRICQKVTSNLGYYQAIPVLAVSVGTTGIQVSSNEHTKQAFQWQVDELKNSILELGFDAVEELLSFLEESPDKFSEYIASDQYARLESFLVENAAEFTRHFEINGSRYLFQQMAYLMRRVEDQVIKKLIGADLLEQLKADTLVDNKKILADDFLKPGIVLLTVAKALIERVISMENGVPKINFKGTYGNMKESMAPNREEIRDMADQLQADGNAFLQGALEFIAANPTGLEDFAPQTARRRFKFTNDKTKGVFGV